VQRRTALEGLASWRPGKTGLDYEPHRATRPALLACGPCPLPIGPLPAGSGSSPGPGPATEKFSMPTKPWELNLARQEAGEGKRCALAGGGLISP